MFPGISIATRPVGQEVEKTQSDRLSEFISTHGIKLEMNGKYTIAAQTLKRDNRKIILTMNSTVAKGKHMPYESFLGGNFDDIAEGETTEKGAHFNLVEADNP